MRRKALRSRVNGHPDAAYGRNRGYWQGLPLPDIACSSADHSAGGECVTERDEGALRGGTASTCGRQIGVLDKWFL